jgi:YihY family inner membrane protein
VSVIERADTFQRSHPRLGFPLAVTYKFIDDQGGYLAALITYYGFLSIFPLLLLFTSVLGFVLRGDPHLQQQILSSALGQFPVVGQDLATGHLGGSTIGVVVGIVGSLYGGLGVAQAGQNAMNVAWAVPRNNRPNPFKARGRSLLLLGTVGLGVVGTTVVAAIGTTARAFGASLGGGTQAVLLVGSVLLNITVFLVAFSVATAADCDWRTLLPGAVIAGVGWQVLQTVGTGYVRHVQNASALSRGSGGGSTTDDTFALVLGLIAFLYAGALLTVIAVEINVVRTKHLYPRSLLTPFTDDVVLTRGDERAYTDAAKAQRNKGFETIRVRFRRRKRPK